MSSPWQKIRPLVVHAALLAGCVVFAFPFLWLVSTSGKRNEELAVFPPQWIPKVPWYSLRSPFVDGNAYGPVERPPQVAETQWQRLQPRIQETLLQAATRVQSGPQPAQAGTPDASPGAPPAAQPLVTDLADADQAAYREQMVRGLWAQARETVPEAAWKEADALPALLARSITPDVAARVHNTVVRRLAVGDPKVRHLNNDLITPDSSTGWQVSGPATLSEGVLEGEACRPVAYDLRQADGFTLVETLRLPVTVDQVQVVNLPIHCDASWHRSEMTIETGGRVYRGERPLYVDIRSWQEAEYAFKEPPYRGSRAIVMRPDDKATTDVTDPHTMRLTWTLHKSSRLRTVFDKYVDSYRWALRYIPFDQQLRNTIILVVMNVLGQIFACSLVAYGFARLKFYGRDVLFGLLLATMMLPAQVTMIPQFVLWKTLGWYNTLQPLWVPAWFGNAFFVFLLRQFFMTIPKELEDAAKIDGCGFFGIYWRIMLPLAGPAIATVAIFSFMGAWNEFVSPLVYLSDERLFPLSLGLNQFRQEQASEWAMLMAASTLMMLPVIGVFFFCQRYFIQGVTLTGLKG
jgi:ABC-type glycerol-3-phosphate transport system permease component